MNRKVGSKTMFYVKERPAEQKRCEAFCPAMPFCSQGQALIAASDPVNSLKNARAALSA
jgi:hypothetical protein